MNCPKCGFQQNEGLECLRCGLVFARYRPSPPPQIHKNVGASPVRTVASQFFRFYKVFRWVSLGILIIAMVLIVRTSKPPDIVVPPDAADHAEEKIRQFQSAMQRGSPDRLRLDQTELNGWLGRNLAFKKPDSAAAGPAVQQSMDSLVKTATGGQALDDMSLQQAQSSVRDLKIELREDTVRLYAVFDMHGVDLSLELEGRITAEDGYIRLEPTAGKLGSLPLLAGTLRSVAERLFDSPENKDKFKLPPEIQNIGIEHGTLVVTPR